MDKKSSLGPEQVCFQRVDVESTCRGTPCVISVLRALCCAARGILLCGIRKKGGCVTRNRYRGFWFQSISQTDQGFHLQALHQKLEERLWQLPLQGERGAYS